MRVVEQSFEVLEWPVDPLQKLERIGRVAYKSEGKIKDGSAPAFVKMLLDRGHESVLEHVSVTVYIVCDRGISHEIVRHRLASYTQESTRYCRYVGDDDKGQVAVVIPKKVSSGPEGSIEEFLRALIRAEESYVSLSSLGLPPQFARAVLPTCLKTELYMTANLREWRHFFNLRCAPAAHPDMQRLAKGMLAAFSEHIPVVFDSIVAKYL